MKYLMAQQSMSRPRTTDLVVDGLDQPLTSIEELVGATPVHTPRHHDRWLGIGVALITAVIGFGFAGRAPTAADTPASTAPVPATPSTTAHDLGGRIDFAFVTRGVSVTRLAVSVSLAADPRRRIETELSGKTLIVTVDGDAPVTDVRVTISIRTPSGQLVASAIAPNVVGDERPASGSGPRMGPGRFAHRFVIARPSSTDGWYVEISRD